MIKANLELIHSGDWTELTKGLEVKLISLYYLINPINHINLEIMLFYGNDPSKFISNLKKHNNIYKVINTKKIRRNLFEISFMGNYNDSIRRVLFQNNVIASSLVVEDRVEKFSIFSLNDNNLETVTNSLAKMKNVNLIKNQRRKYDIVDAIQLLTPLESRIIIEAYNRGFFEHPRNITLDKLAEEFGITKTTLNFHLRNAIRKIISNFLYNQ
ncbi:bacterio-opsin activator [Sulfolobus sp. A20-N-F6]|nr:bacterio-opsin activator [Sulfolobus sp. A20-N-F6]